MAPSIRQADVQVWNGAAEHPSLADTETRRLVKHAGKCTCTHLGQGGLWHCLRLAQLQSESCPGQPSNLHQQGLWVFAGQTLKELGLSAASSAGLQLSAGGQPRLTHLCSAGSAPI